MKSKSSISELNRKLRETRATGNKTDMRSYEKSEKWIEATLVRKVESRGGKCFKWVSPQFTGVPDRIVLMPGAGVYFVELKSFRKQLSPRQQLVRNLLNGLGFEYFKISTKEELENFVSKLSKYGEPITDTL